MIVLIFAGFAFISPIFAESDQETASFAITTTENEILSAYKAVLEAEQAGGNASSLFARLNEAGEYLATARMSFRNGDFNNTVRLADVVRSIVGEVQDAAVGLKDSASREGSQRMQFTMITSGIGTALIALGSFWLWRFLKKRYGGEGFQKRN